MSNKYSEEFNFYEAELVKSCNLFKSCKNIVVGKGNIKSKILFVGEAPGRNEDEQGIPFCGAAGKKLDDLLEKIGVTLSDVYITNILKCRPPENRDPLPEEITKHTPWLIKQIKEMRPLLVLSLGNYATKFFLSGGDVEKMKKAQGITSVHGKVIDARIGEVGFKLIPLFHPAAILYNKNLEHLWEKDIGKVKEEVLRIKGKKLSIQSSLYDVLQQSL